MTSPQPIPVGSSASDAQPDGKTNSPPTAPIADGAASSIAPEASVQPVDHSATIDPESDQASQATSSDSDSTLGSVASFTTSLRSSVYGTDRLMLHGVK